MSSQRVNRTASVRTLTFQTLCFILLLRLVRPQVGSPRPLEYEVNEELEAGTLIGDVRTDSNITRQHTEDESLRLRFSFRNPSPISRLFQIDEVLGIIRTAQVLDRDTICSSSSVSCDLGLDITVKPLQFFQIIKVVVHIVDINDNSPVFPQPQISLSIVETALPGALFPLPTAEDDDSGLLGVQDYQLLTDFDLFELKVSDQVDGSKDVRLRLTKSLDRETLDHYYVTVLALDGGRPPKSGSVFVDIEVLDANDNAPKFENASYEVSVFEDLPTSTTLLRVRATDPDEGPNGVVVYGFSDDTQLTYGSTFGIDNHTGAIYLKNSLDYEQSPTIQLTVKAKDQGSNSHPVFVKVTVYVLDVNDNPPQITVSVVTPSRRVEVQENSDPGEFLAHVEVKDSDLGVSGQFDCAIDNRNLFRLEPFFAREYKIVTVVSFDREVQDTYTLTLSCWDGGKPSLTSSARITVFVTDENDHAPKISQSLYEIYLEENTPPNTVIAKIEATDEDSGKNKALQYRINSLDRDSEGVLSIDLITGRVKASVAFDYEDRRQYSFLVTVSDQGDEPKSATATLLLHIRDTNDEKPLFDRSMYHFSTRENLPAGTVIGRVSATDRDLSPQFKEILYRLRYTSELFEVDRISGEIVNMRRLDREAEPIHRLSIVAYNRGQPNDLDSEGKVNVTIVIDDENDNAPVFMFPTPLAKTAQISGSSANVGTLITRLVAADIDSDRNAQIRYEISHGNEEGLFEIDSMTGVITVAKWPLTEAGTVNKVFPLVVVAKDSGSPPLATVADLVVLLNNTGQPNYAAHEAGSGVGGFFEGNNMAIFVGALLGSLLVLALVVVGSIFVYRHHRTAKQKISSPIVCEQLKPLSGMKYSCRSLNTVDSASVISGGSRETVVAPVATCRTFREGNAGGSMVLHPNIEEDDSFLDRITPDWPLRPAQSMRIPKKTECCMAHDVSLDVLQRPAYNDCSCRERRTGPGRPCIHQHQHHTHRHRPYCGLCNSAPRISHSTSARNKVADGTGQKSTRTTVTTHGDRATMRRSPQGDMDAESACSAADSGRGPSEEDDLQQLALAAAAAVAAASLSSAGAPGAATAASGATSSTTNSSVTAEPSPKQQPASKHSQRERIER